MFDNPIKIRWTGEMRHKIKEDNQNLSSEESDIFVKTVSRQKTNLILINIKESNIAYNELSKYHSTQCEWMNRSMDMAIQRICDEILLNISKRGFDSNDRKEYLDIK